MTIWMIFIKGDDHTWLEGAWDDDMTMENPEGWQDEVKRCRKLAFDEGFEMRIMQVDIPGVFKAFDIPHVTYTGT